MLSIYTCRQPRCCRQSVRDGLALGEQRRRFRRDRAATGIPEPAVATREAADITRSTVSVPALVPVWMSSETWADPATDNGRSASRYAVGEIDRRLHTIAKYLRTIQPKRSGALIPESFTCGKNCLGCPHYRWGLWLAYPDRPLRETNTPQSISDSIVVAHPSASAFVSKVAYCRGQPLRSMRACRTTRPWRPFRLTNEAILPFRPFHSFPQDSCKSRNGRASTAITHCFYWWAVQGSNL